MKRHVLPLIACCLAILMVLTSCNTVKVPKPEDFIEDTTFDEWTELAKTVDEKALIKAWGVPEKVGNQCLWSVAMDGGVRYIAAYTENGDVISVSPSFPLFVVVAEKTGDSFYCFIDFHDYSIDSGKVATMPLQDIFGNSIECEVGDLFYFEFDGMVMESYPAQLNKPYSATKMGTASEEELSQIAEEMKTVHTAIGG